MTLEDSFSEDGLARLHFYIVNQLVIGDSNAELDDIKMPRGKLLGAIGREVDVCVIRQNTLLLQTLPFPADSPNVNPG
ncbi:MAG: hypothetical protein JO151_09500 [Verrucomicrobia bacterium]|nr:hypothetical protein [Verrucomicrobiota bacterium]